MIFISVCTGFYVVYNRFHFSVPFLEQLETYLNAPVEIKKQTVETVTGVRSVL